MNSLTAVDGKHILAEFWQCQCHADFIRYAEPLTEQLCEAVRSVGLTLVGQAVHEFQAIALTDNSHNRQSTQQNGGFTVSLLLAESHLCLHTWSETATVTLDIYVCNMLTNNSRKAEKLLKICHHLLQPANSNIKVINRYHAAQASVIEHNEK